MDFRFTVLMLLATTFVVAPLVTEAPTAHACQYYGVFCPVDFRVHYGCGNVATGPAQALLSCAREATLP